MGKLSGVQTLDMVNGEIMKVAYDGAEYAKAGEHSAPPKVGDIFLALRSRPLAYTEGNFYEIAGYGNGISEVDGDYQTFYSRYAPEANSGEYALIRFVKVVTYSPTLEQRVTALESEVSTLKGEANPATSETTETITFEDAEYRKVDRKAREGDVVIQTAETGSLIVKQGVPYKVELNGSCSGLSVNNRDLYNAHTGRTRETVDVYELVPGQAPKFAVGDYAKVVKSDRGKESSIVQITDDSAGLRMRKKNGDVVDADCLGVAVGESQVYGFTTDQLVEATAEEIAAASKPKLKAGDFVKIVDGDAYFTDKAYEVFADEDGDLYVLDDDGDERYSVLDGDAYELVDAETAKWAKIRRNVGEFRVGDIARVIEDVCGKKVGKIFEVKRVNKYIVACDEGYRYDVGKHVELIAPVEAVLA